MTIRFVSVFAVTLLAWTLVGCGSSGSSPSPPPPLQAATPTFSVPPGTYSSAQTVTISDATPGATIYYTTDGTTPTTSSTQYTGPITVSSTETIEAIATASGYSTSAVATATYTITPLPVAVVVDFGSSQQTIRGFGGSSAWIMDMNAHPGQADALYGNSGSQQIGLSILRVRIDPSGSPPSYVTSNWGTELNNAKLASARGAIVFASPWSPPAAMKSNNDVNNGGSLNPASYGDYANYLEGFVTYMQSGGVSLYGISMQNEPDWTATYESCRWTGPQMDTWVANNSSVVTATGVKLIMPESLGFDISLSDPALNDPIAEPLIAIIGGHLYGAPNGPFYYTNAENLGKDVWMTEHTISDTDLTGALELAKEVHDSMTVGNYNAYVYWWLQNWTVNNSSPYVNGLIDDPGLDNNLTLNGYAMGQFSKFIRPGYVRSNATSNSTSNIYVSAYKGSGHYVIVAINPGTTDVDQPFVIQNQTVTSMTPYRTSATENLAQLSVVGVTDNSFTYRLPAQSITTFVE